MKESGKDKDKILEELSAPFVGVDGKPAHRWRVQSFTNKEAVCVPYLSTSQVIERLNSVLGIDGWENTLIETSGEGIICELTIYFDGEKRTKSNVGMPAKQHEEKSRASDSLKRAASLFGIGEYLKDEGNVKLPRAQKHALTHEGKSLENPDDLTNYINYINHNYIKLAEIYRSIPKNKIEIVENLFIKLGKFLKDIHNEQMAKS